MRYRILIPCPGLGVVKRGYEAALAQCAHVLRETDQFDVMVFGGKYAPGIDVAIPSVQRSWLAPAGDLISPKRAYRLEQASFFTMSAIKMLRFAPHVVYVSDQPLAHHFFTLRRYSGLKYRILFRNGAPCKPPFSYCDHVQQLHPFHYAEAIDRGESPEKMTLLPPGFTFASVPATHPRAGSTSLRKSLGLPDGRPILIAVGAIGNNYKRSDYNIEEVARLQDRPFLVMLGELDRGADRIKALASELLGEGVLVRTVPGEELPRYLQAADLFVHAAFSEGFGRAIIEAAAEGKPCLLHDTEVYRSLLGEYPCYADFSQAGSLAALVRACLAKPLDTAHLIAQQQFVREQYSWQSVSSTYIDLIRDQAKLALQQ